MAPASASGRSAAAKILVRVALALAAVAALGFAVMKSARSSRSQAYAIPQAHLGPWTLTVEVASQPNEPVLMLRPPSALATDLFDQTFKRSMESMRAPELGGIPLVLAGELARAGSERISPDELLMLARRAGLETTQPVPRCMAHRRLPEPDARQQLYFAIWTSQPFDAFRSLLRERLGEKLDPGFVTPVLFVGLVESPLQRWLPLHANPEKDCVAPIEIATAAP